MSGLAFGVDGAAHRGALEGPGPTVAVLGRGADRSYPRAHATLFERILDEGLVVEMEHGGEEELPLTAKSVGAPGVAGDGGRCISSRQNKSREGLRPPGR